MRWTCTALSSPASLWSSNGHRKPWQKLPKPSISGLWRRSDGGLRPRSQSSWRRSDLVGGQAGRCAGRASSRLARLRPDLPVPARPLYQLHRPDLGQGAVPVRAGRRCRADPPVAETRPDQAQGIRLVHRRGGALSRLGPLCAEHCVPAAAHQWADPAHLFDHHRLRAVPDGDAGQPPADRRIVPGLRPGHSDRMPARGPCGFSACQRRGPQPHLQARHLRERPAGHAVLRSRQAEVLRVRTRERDLLLHPVHVPVDGDQHLALEAGRLCRSGRRRTVCHAGADAPADADADRCPTCCS